MAFRHIADTDSLSEVEHEPGDFIWLKQIFGMENGEPAIQTTGSIFCKQGRVIIYPSTVQHRLTRFELKDKSKPGWMRSLVFYLVDPNIRIISTANIPPQRLDWTMDIEGDDSKAAVEKVILDHKDEKGSMPLSLTEALELRLEVLNDMVEFWKYQQVAFESRMLTL